MRPLIAVSHRWESGGRRSHMETMAPPYRGWIGASGQSIRCRLSMTETIRSRPPSGYLVQWKQRSRPQCCTYPLKNSLTFAGTPPMSCCDPCALQIRKGNKMLLPFLPVSPLSSFYTYLGPGSTSRSNPLADFVLSAKICPIFALSTRLCRVNTAVGELECFSLSAKICRFWRPLNAESHSRSHCRLVMPHSPPHLSPPTLGGAIKKDPRGSAHRLAGCIGMSNVSEASAGRSRHPAVRRHWRAREYRTLGGATRRGR
jgi:hypothetical protein